MILFFSRSQPVRFPRISRAWHRAREAVYQSLLDLRLGHGGGSALVVENLLKELRGQNVHWAVSDRCMPSCPVDVIWVVRGAADLQWAIQRKKEIGAKQLWAGPNIVVTPDEKNGILRAPEIDHCITPSDWISEWYVREAPELRDKVAAWPVGIDTTYWSSPGGKTRGTLLVYNKRQDALLKTLIDKLNAVGVGHSIINYGGYARADYRDALKKSWGMFFLSQSESQGLAVLECLSMNVPVLAWNPGAATYESPELKRTYALKSSSIPYFDARCGDSFASADDFDARFAAFREALPRYAPREYVLENKLSIETNFSRFPLLLHLR